MNVFTVRPNKRFLDPPSLSYQFCNMTANFKLFCIILGLVKVKTIFGPSAAAKTGYGPSATARTS